MRTGLQKQQTLEIQTLEFEPQLGCCIVTLVELVISPSVHKMDSETPRCTDHQSACPRISRTKGFFRRSGDQPHPEEKSCS